MPAICRTPFHSRSIRNSPVNFFYPGGIMKPSVLMLPGTNDTSTQIRVNSSHCISHKIRSRLSAPPALTTMALYHSSRGQLPTADPGGPATISSQAYAYLCLRHTMISPCFIGNFDHQICERP